MAKKDKNTLDYKIAKMIRINEKLTNMSRIYESKNIQIHNLLGEMEYINARAKAFIKECEDHKHYPFEGEAILKLWYKLFNDYKLYLILYILDTNFGNLLTENANFNHANKEQMVRFLEELKDKQSKFSWILQQLAVFCKEDEEPKIDDDEDDYYLGEFLYEDIYTYEVPSTPNMHEQTISINQEKIFSNLIGLNRLSEEGYDDAISYLIKSARRTMNNSDLSVYMEKRMEEALGTNKRFSIQMLRNPRRCFEDGITSTIQDFLEDMKDFIKENNNKKTKKSSKDDGYETCINIYRELIKKYGDMREIVEESIYRRIDLLDKHIDFINTQEEDDKNYGQK